jgi:DNA-binding Lrp family transcriptional regulator
MEQQGDYIAKEEIEEGLDMIGKGYNEPQEIIDESDLRKYRIELPNLYDDSDLDVYEFRLLAHYKRVGRCTESTRTTAKKTKMSPAQVSEKRKSIRDKGFIQMQEVPLDDKQFSYIIIVLDKWKENFEKYSTRSLSEHPRTPHEHPVHSVKQRSNHIKKDPIKKVKEAAAPQPPEILLFREVVSHYPKKPQREMVIEAIQKVNARLGRDATIEDLQPFFTAWCKVSANDWSLVWLIDWAVPGFVGNGQKPAQPSGISVAQSWLARKEQEAQSVRA